MFIWMSADFLKPEDHGGHDVVKVEYATPQKTAKAMRSFIDGELTRLNKFALESIFCMFSLVPNPR